MARRWGQEIIASQPCYISQRAKGASGRHSSSSIMVRMSMCGTKRVARHYTMQLGVDISKSWSYCWRRVRMSTRRATEAYLRCIWLRSRGDLVVIQLLLQHGANVDLQDLMEGTAFQIALARGEEKAIRLLSNYKSDDQTV